MEVMKRSASSEVFPVEHVLRATQPSNFRPEELRDVLRQGTT